MTLTEKWNSIVSDFQANKSSKEEVVQKLWEEIFADADVFGYSKRSGEIDIWRNVQVGSRERTIPDIIIRDSINDKDLFVVELKQHNLPFNQAYKEQLFSYMRLLEIKVGVLICDKLYIYYRENNNTECSIEISFKKNSTIGEKFINLFSKGDFNEDRIKDFSIEIEKTKSNVSLIKSNLQQLDLKKLLTEHYLEKYSIEEIELALKDLKISIAFDSGDSERNHSSIDTPIRNPHPYPGPQYPSDTTKYLFNGQIYGKARLVLAVVKKYMQDNPNTTAQSLLTIFPKELQGAWGVIKLLSETHLKCQDPEKRFFLRPNDIIHTATEECAVCSQWGIFNINNFIDKARSLGMKIDKH